MLMPVLYALGIMAIFYLGVLFGAWMIESDHKRIARAQKAPLMELADHADDYPGGAFHY